MFLIYLDAEHLMARSGNSVTLTEMTLGRVLWVDLGILLTSVTTGERDRGSFEGANVCVYELTIFWPYAEISTDRNPYEGSNCCGGVDSRRERTARALNSPADKGEAVLLPESVVIVETKEFCERRDSTGS